MSNVRRVGMFVVLAFLQYVTLLFTGVESQICYGELPAAIDSIFQECGDSCAAEHWGVLVQIDDNSRTLYDLNGQQVLKRCEVLFYCLVFRSRIKQQAVNLWCCLV